MFDSVLELREATLAYVNALMEGQSSLLFYV